MRLRKLLAKAVSAWRGGAGEAADFPRVTLVGFPSQPTGRGEHVRAISRALAAGRIPAALHDLERSRHGPDLGDPTFAAVTRRRIQGDIRIFSLNGDEIEAALRRLERRQRGAFAAGYNIVYPAWELPRYPKSWAAELDRFDEVWAATAFVYDSLKPAISVPLLHMRNACEPHLSRRFGREHFGLPQSSWLILCVFDAQSRVSRKNPWASVEAFRRLVAARPHSNAHLVLKLNHADRDPAGVRSVLRDLAGIIDHVTVLAATMSGDEARSLIGCCDCLLSLHRSEGFGRALAEAMFLAKPVVATGWSGNMEFMHPDVSFPVAYELIPVSEGDFPAWEDQVWAEADLDDSVRALLAIADDPAHGAGVGRRARAHMQTHFSDDVLGARYRERIAEIAMANEKRLAR